jgi:(1->4)-alpha-D-glucan 1-alpha-D-glucosylmutase
VHAKGVEDTAFNRWNRFVALNEVGGDPGRFSLPVAAFHEASLARPPGGLLATTTHDTKRSGDVRARLLAIGGDPAAWESVVRARIGGWRDPNEAYVILQTVLGAWPLTPERLELYLEKALREAKVNTTWLEQDHDWEAGAKAWAVGLLEDEELGAYASRLSERASRIVLGTTLLKLTVPGVPDLYQGDELPYLALVDPDNRRPVDWSLRARLVDAAEKPPKLRVITETLALRARRPEAFAGAYEPVEAGEDVVAFTRGGELLVAVAVRGDLSRFRPPPGAWRDVLRDETLLLAQRRSVRASSSGPSR